MRAVYGLILVLVLTPVCHSADKVDYVREIKPILQARCVSCHGAVRQKAGLRLDAGQLLLKGTRRGPVVVPGKPEESSLLAAIVGEERDRMPPEGEGEALTAAQIATVRRWIEQGAKAPEEAIPADPQKHWAYQPITSPPVPGPGHPIDAFLNQTLASRNITPNPEADRATLLRRVTFDLTGLPPTPQELQAFLDDTSPQAYEKVVDRLLASPRYGERWGRHWMDVWRYSDPFGLGEEYRYSQRHIWRWRDWIIDALNADKGYDRMVHEMLAGDELAPLDPDTLRATGYLARNWYKFNRNVWIQDTVEYTAAGFLGMTLRCARCHDHKFDPVSQEDYYRFRAFFEPHDVRIDRVPGQPDPNKDGVARVFDAKPETPTYLFLRGDERTPDTSRVMAPAVPEIIGQDVAIRPTRVAPADYRQALGPAAEQARGVAREAHDRLVQRAEGHRKAIAEWQDRQARLERGETLPPEPQTPWLADLFEAKRTDQWEVRSGAWVWEQGKLICKAPSSFATVRSIREHPKDLMGRVRFRTTGGKLGSVGVGFDVAGKDFQAIYTYPGSASAVQVFHQVNGQQAYPQEGIVKTPLLVNQEYTLDFAIRDNKVVTWLNGQVRNVYTMPVPRQAGRFSIWTHEATAEILECRILPLPAGVVLPQSAMEPSDTPLSLEAVPVTLAGVQAAVAEEQARMGSLAPELALAQAQVVSVEARIAADEARYADTQDPLLVAMLSHAAAQAERHLALLEAEQALQAAERKHAATTEEKAKAAAAQAVETARKTHQQAKARLQQHDRQYTPLVTLMPEESTGRRLALARWLTANDNPLTARVAVNHIWLRHFGKALVPSVANFGLSGSPPTHPALLDWLASEFIRSGWKMKPLHRLMVTSAAYRRTSVHRETTDPENQTLWRMNPRRLEAEAVRDALIALGGNLDLTMGGPVLDEKQGATVLRRSLYFRFNTEYKMTFLDQFDPASPTECFERRESVIPQQALTLSNSALALNQSRVLEKTLTASDPADAGFVRQAYVTILGRPPRDEETKRCLEFLAKQAALLQNPAKLTPFPPTAERVTPPASDPARRAREDLLQVLFNHNDFVTIR